MRGLHPLRVAGPGRAIIAGGFTTVNGANPTAINGWGISSIVRDGEGLWTVTLIDPVVQIDAVLVDIALEDLPGSGANENVNCFVDQDTITTQAFQIEVTTVDDTSANAPAASDEPGSYISFVVVAKLTSVSDPL